MKQDLRKKDAIINAVEKVKISAQEYIEVLNDFGYSYNENLDEILKQYGSDVFDASVKKDQGLLMRIKAVIDKEAFKEEIIKKEGYDVNERISKAHAEHMIDLKEVRNHIPNYKIGGEYDIELCVFEGSKVYKLLQKICDSYEPYMELLDLVKPSANLYQSRMLKGREEHRGPMFRIPEGLETLLTQTQVSNFMWIKEGKPIIVNDVLRLHDPNWIKIVETIKV